MAQHTPDPQMTEGWYHYFKATAPYGDRQRITVEAGLHKLRGNDRPYFSVTAEIRRLGVRDCESCGCLHDEILKIWPQLAPVVALHLSDDNGQPMHMEANGWYQLAGYYGGAGEQYHAANAKRQIWRADGTFDAYREPTPDECLASFAAHVRVPLDDARTLADGFRSMFNGKIVPEWTRANYRDWLVTQLPRFQTEADAAIALLDALSKSRLPGEDR